MVDKGLTMQTRGPKFDSPDPVLKQTNKQKGAMV